MAKSFDTISPESIVVVKKNWHKLKEMRKYEEKAGSVLFQHLFKVCPDAQVLFGFSLEQYTDTKMLIDSRRFLMHASFLMEMIDETIDILGQDNDKLASTLEDIGKKHSTYGVRPEYFPFMTDSIVHTLNHFLGNGFSQTDKATWEEVFGTLIQDIVEAQKNVELEEAAKSKQAVLDTWTKFYKKDDLTRGGVLLFQNLFEKCPEAKPLFGFPLDFDLQKEDLMNSKRFLIHSSFLIEMIDKTVKMLGDDNETLHQSLMELGKMHVTYGVKPAYFPMMTTSIIHMLKEQLGDDFKKSDESAWKSVLGALISDMIQGQRKLEKGLAAVNKVDVIKSWRLLSQIKNYEEHAGVILFKHLFKKLPQAMPLFGFPMNMDVEALTASKRFLTHASFLIGMIEKALNMLGEQDDELTKLMEQLGEKHVKYGVKPEFFPHMTDALIATMHELLSVRFEEKDEHAWEEVLAVLIADMTRAQRGIVMKEEAEAVKNATITTVRA